MVSTTTQLANIDTDGRLSALSKHWGEAERERLVQAIALLSTRQQPLDSRLGVAEIIADLGLGPEALIAGMLTQSVRENTISLSDVTAASGEAVAQLVAGVTKLDFIGDLHQQGQPQGRQLESMRQMLLAMAEDIRVVVIKLALRLYRVRHLKSLPGAQQRLVARETLDIFAPLANRLGIGKLKWELEDLSMRYLEPDAYRQLAQALEQRRREREAYIQAVMTELGQLLASAGIRAEISGRVKHIYSIWRKMQRKGRSFEQLFDLRAVRIMVDSINDCYAALGAVHSHWSHIPREFDDYIANPKANGYRSLHTAVVGPDGKTLEVQIRTRDMHEAAELGLAAHWQYKEGSAVGAAAQGHINWLRQVLEVQDEDADDDLLERFKAEAFQDRVYVITPKSGVVDLPAGATPLDFAYHIHTEVGHRCRGAKVNGRIVPLNQELHTGDQVDVLTAKNVAPSRDWLSPHLGYLKSSRARQKVRHWFKQQDQARNISAGKSALERECRRLDVVLKADTLQKVAGRFNFNHSDELYAALGHGVLTTGQVMNRIQELILPPPEPESIPLGRSRAAGIGEIQIRGVGKLLTQMANCCKPVPCDPIVGFITVGRGVTIHREDCPNLLNLAATHEERLIEVDWGDEPEALYRVDIAIEAHDRPGLLRDITAVIANERVNVIAVNTRSDDTCATARMALTVEITDVDQLSRLLDRIDRLPNVLHAARKSR